MSFLPMSFSPMSRILTFLFPVGVAAGVLAVSSPAAAQSSGGSAASWRQRSRNASLPDAKFTFEARFGAYYPEVDEELNGAATPFADYFGKGAQFYFGLELDWTPIRIPYVGRLGPSFGWGITTMNGQATIVGDTPSTGADSETTSGPSTSLTIHAMHTSAVLRVDEIARRTVVPIVPYAKVGFGFGIWNSGTANGTSKAGSDCAATTPASCTVAEGMSIGPHIALGGMLGLNWLDPRSGVMGRQNSGINQVYLFGEWMWANLDSGVGKTGMHIGTSTWVLGLALDF